jgi:hypothetical protein
MTPASHGDGARSPKPTTDGQAPGDPAVGSHLLDQILTLSEGGIPKAGFVEPNDVGVLASVAQRLAGRPFGLEPVAIELVHAMLQVQFEKAGIPATTLHEMAEHIATTLYDDPPSRERLESLWRGLSAKSA